jgi:tetratricopeptide (TPR) repeat protein
MDAQRPCPDSALLAAFLDGSLADYERTAVVTHLAECPQCRAVALTVVEFHEVQALDGLWQQVAPPAPPPPLVETGALRWSREKTRAPAMALVAVAAAAAVAISLPLLIPARSAPPSAATLRDLAEGHRPLEARLSGTRAYAPPPLTSPPGAAPDRSSIHLIATATDVRAAFAANDAEFSGRAVGIAALLAGDLNDAIATLEIAAAADPSDLRVANDLAAAYYERSQRADRPDDLPAALSAVERALESAPAHPEALFNRALIITALGLRAEAETAWQDYIARDPSSGWTGEARVRLRDILPAVSSTDWPALRQALDADGASSDAARAVRQHASAARYFIENDLLRRWIAAARANDRAGEDRILDRMEVLGAAFAKLAADRLYDDLVKAIRAARRAHDDTRVVAAHEEYLGGIALMAAQSFSEAAPVLRRASRGLAAVESPLYLRAQIELAATAYYQRRLTDAAAVLGSVKAAARERGYTILVTRAAWLEGMAAFGLNEFAKARIAYEEMLASAGAGGDTDQWVMANVLLANLHDMLGDVGRAWQHRVSAASRLGDVYSETTRLNHLLSAAGDAQAGGHHAAALLFQSLTLTGSAVPPNLEVQARAQRARSLLRLGRNADASAEVAQARGKIASVVNPSSRVVVEADVLAAETDVWRHQDPPKALAAAAKLLSSPLVQRDHIRRARAQLQLAEIVLAQGDMDRAERALREGLAALDTLHSSPSAEFAIRASDPVWGLYSTAAQIALRRGNLSSAFAYTEMGRIRTRQERRVWAGSVASLDEVQRALGGDTALVVLTQLDDQLQVWLIRRDDVATHTLPISSWRATALVAAQLREMVDSASRPKVSAELFDSLFRPVLRLLGDAGQLVVVADAPYNRIAFAGLWDRRRDRYVVEEHRLILAPNATAVVRAVQRSLPVPRHPLPRRAAIVGTMDTAAAHGRFASVSESLSTVYGASRLTWNDAATAAHLIEKVATGDIVHVTARVVPNSEFPGLSHVLMTDEAGQKYSGTVFARRIADRPPRAQLVALESGPRGSSTPPSADTFGIARALLAAGIPHVVSPVTDVEVTGVERTWLDFHRHYADGVGAAESLRRAQLAALSASARRPGPWATLTVFGSTQ